ncbi:MAG: glycosyltransferase [marine benthic group bacterium]|nr:glycosyltransferase [Gemmatimonadota bacterium]
MTPATIRVVHIIHALGPGGAEHTLVELALAASEQQMVLCVVSLMPLGSNSYAGRLRELGIEVHTLDLASRWDPRGLERGRRTIEEFEPDIIHSHLKHADLVGAWASRRLGIPLVSTLHLIEHAPTAVGRGKRWLAAQARLLAASRTIAVSEPLRDWYLDTFRADPATVVRIPNAVASIDPASDGDRLAVRREMGVRPAAILAVTIGVLRPEKGHTQLLAAVERIRSDIDVQFVIVGDGPERAALEAEALRSGLMPDRVVFAGFRDDVPAVLAASDLVIHPSLEDALPTALLYALAAGVPVVASDVGGIPEIVTPGTGILVRPGSADALAEGVQEMIERLPADDMRAAARARFRQEYEVSIWALRLRTLYDEVLAEYRETLH